MPSAQSEHARRYTFEEYLELESNSEQKHEFLDGEVLAMSGASYPRVQISGNILHYLRLQFGNGPCQVFNPDLRVRQEQSRKYVYPDATVIYDEPEFDEADKARTTVNNPLVVFEVLSRSTAGYDLGIKFLNYQKIQSLRGFVAIAQDSPSVQAFHRDEQGQWILWPVFGLDAEVKLEPLGLSLPMRQIYERVQLPAETLDAAMYRELQEADE